MDIISVLSKYYKGQEWSLNGDAYERLIWYDERNTLPKPTLEELTTKYNELGAAQPLVELRTKRNTVLDQSDKYATIDYPHATVAKQQEWLDYRQALRDLPSVTEDPLNPVWPLVPSP
jgi:hypothetical protein